MRYSRYTAITRKCLGNFMRIFANYVNPEFQRNIWKQFSLHRLIAMPIILTVIFYVSYSWHEDKLAVIPDIANYLMLLLLVIWGTGLSADAIFEEIQDHTWETQRMTPLGAWSMAWGKLLGTTSYVWYGVILCSVAFFMGYAFLNTQSFSQTLFDYCHCILTGLAATAFAFFCALLVQRISPLRSRARVTLIQLFAIFVFLLVYGFGKSSASFPPLFLTLYSEHSWYNLNLPYDLFVLLSHAFVIGLLLISIYRLLRVELQVKTTPWYWPVAVVLWVLYCLGYVYLPQKLMDVEIPASMINAMYWGVAYLIILNLTFLAAFFYPKNIIHAYRWVGSIKDKEYGKIFRLTPVWILSLLIASLVLIPLIYFINQGAAFEGKKQSFMLIGFSVSMILFLLRDIGILYFLCWNPRAKRAHLATIVYLILLYAFVPTLLQLVGLPSYFLPMLSPGAWFVQTAPNLTQIMSICLLLILQIIAVGYGVLYRWKQQI